MSVRDCIKLVENCDPEDAAAVKAMQKDLVSSGVPGDDAWTQAAELVMEAVLNERNELAAEIREKGGYLEDLDIENLLNPASYARGGIRQLGEGGETLEMKRRTFLKGVLGTAAAGAAVRGGIGPADRTTLGRAKPLSDEAVDQPLPPAVEKIIREDGPIDEALRILSEEGPEEIRALAKLLSKLIPRGVISLEVNSTDYVGAHGALKPLKNGARLSLYTKGDQNGLDVGTFMHEALHAAVAARYYTLSVAMIGSNYDVVGMSKSQADKVMGQLRSVWLEFRRAVDESEIENTSQLAVYNNPDEFFVRALTDPGIQRFLASREYKGKTLWDRFVDWVKFSLFGYERTGQVPSWLDAAMTVSEELLEVMAADQPNFAFSNAIIDKKGESQASEMAVEKPALGANQRKGTLSILKKEHPDAHAAVQSALRRMPRKEAAQVRRNLKEHAGTGWAAAAVKSLVIRDVFDGLMTGRDVEAMMNSKFWGNDPLSRYSMVKWLARGPAGAKHLIDAYSFVGTNRKAENDVSGSFLNCEPSKACAKFCYAVKANARHVELMKAEFTELAARMYPEETASAIVRQYSRSPAGFAGLSLRVNDKGDLSDAQVDLIDRINQKGVPLQVFSKRPELLRKLSNINLKMLSVDDTNIEVARANPDLNLAVTITEGITEEMIAEINDRVSVYLPINLRGKAWTQAEIKSRFPNQHKNMRNMMCPVEAGRVGTREGVSFVDIKEGMADGNWTCTACDLLGAVGCFHNERKTENRKAAMGLFEITVNEAQNDVQKALTALHKDLRKLEETGAVDGNTIESIFGDLRQAVRIPQQGNDPDPEATGTEGGGPEGGRDTGEREATRTDADSDEGALRLQGPTTTEQISHRRKVGQWLKKPLRRLSNRLPVKIVNNEDDVDFEVPPKAAGYKYKGVVYLFRDYIRDQAEAVMAVTHEAIGHLGIEGVLGRKKFNELLGDVQNIMVEIMMDSSGKLHPKVRAIQAELRKYYIDENGKYALSPREEAREIIAHIAHSKPRLGRLREIYNKIRAWVGEFLADMGIGDPTVAQIESALVRATDYVTDPETAFAEDTEQGAAMRRVRPRPPPDPETPSEPETDVYQKLGLGGKEATSVWKAVSQARWGNIKEAINTATARGYEGLFDGLIAIKALEKKAGVGLGRTVTYLTPDGIEKQTVDYENSAYVSARLATGIADMMTHILHWGALQWEGGVVQPVEGTRGFLEMMKDLGEKNLNDWLVWMGSNRADQLMRVGKEKNLTRAEIDEGMALAGEPGSERYQLFHRIKNEYAALNRLQLDFAQEAGLINPEKRREWESEWYVPFYRQTEDEIVLGPNTKRGLSHQSAGIRRIRGAKIPTADLMQNILQNWIRLTDASVKNHALRQMMDNFQGTEYISDETLKFKKALVPKNQLHKFIKENREFAQRLAEWLNLDPKTTADGIWDAVSDLSDEGLQEIWQIVAPTDPDVVRVQRGGKNHYYRIHVPGLLRATGHMNPREWQFTRGMRAARWFKQLLTVGVTASPDFMMRNFIRDAAHSWAINKDNMFFLKDSIKGLIGEDGSLRAGTLHRAMMAAGASFQGGYVHATNPEETAQILRRELIKAGVREGEITSFISSIVDTPSKLTKVIGRGWQHYRDAGDRIENASRVATAEAGRRAGKPEVQWLFESKDLMDYSRRGNFAALIFLTDTMPFLNARLQGLDKLGRAWNEDRWMVTKKMGMIAAFSVFLATLNDDDEDYQALPDWEKDAYWHVYPPGPTGKKEHVRIPKPFEIGFIAGTMPERMFRAWVTDSQPNEKVIWALNHGIRETLNINVYPQFILPVAEIKANRHFYFDQPIETLSERKNVIPKERYNSYTSETAVWFADTRVAEWLELSPKQLEHLWNGYTGTNGAYLLAAVDRMVTGPAGGFPKPEEVQLEDMPLVKSLYRGQRKRTTQWQIDFYDRLEEVTQIYGTLKKYHKELVEARSPENQAAAREKYESYKAENMPKLKYRRALTRYQRNFSQLRKRRDAILKDDNLSPAEKYQQSQEIQARINELAKQIELATREGFQ